MTTTVSIREYARRRGVTHRAVQQAIEAGRIDVRREQRGARPVYFIDPVLADRQWNERTDHTYRRSKTRAEKAAPPAVAQPGAPVAPVVATAPASLYGQAKTARETYAAKIAELEYRERAGELVELEKVKTEFRNIAEMVKTNLLNIPDRISSIVAAEQNEKVVHDMVSHEIRAALEKIMESA